MRHPAYRDYPQAQPRTSWVASIFTIIWAGAVVTIAIAVGLDHFGLFPRELLYRFIPPAQTTVNGVAPAIQPRPLPAPRVEQPVAAPLPTVERPAAAVDVPAEAAPVVPTAFWAQDELNMMAATSEAFYNADTLPTPAPAFVDAAIGGDDGAKACGGSPLCGGMTNAEAKATMEVRP